MNKMTIDDINVKGKRVFVRVDFNVPQDENLRITDDTRIAASLPTIKKIIENGGKAILASHLGRPKGVNDKERLIPAARRLQELLGKSVVMAPDCVGPEVKKMAEKLKDGDVVLLENLRFHKEEEKNDPGFAKQLAELAEIYVNDAFGSAHRAHASTEGITHFLSPCVAGYLMKKEIEYLVGALTNPKRPFLAVIGGAKVSTKIDVITNLLEKVDTLIIGGAMAYTFFKAKGIQVGRSLVEEDKIPEAKQILVKAIEKSVPLLLPIDHVVADKIAPDAKVTIVTRMGIPDDVQGVDIGPKTIEKFGYAIKSAKMIVWNGPVGIFEIDKFSQGTTAIARLIAESGAVTIVGGGDSVAAVTRLGLASKMSHISTGGGASLELLEGKELPGLTALTDRK